jgi:hypothetical protein
MKRNRCRIAMPGQGWRRAILGLVLAGGLVPITARAQQHGLLREVYTGIPGNAVESLLSHPSYPDSPSSTNLITDVFEAPIDVMDEYGQRVHGYLLPPETGDYVFWISSDDASHLLLSPSPDPAAAVLIAQVTGWTPPRNWFLEANQRSNPIRLEANKVYYIAALMKEQGGGDNLAVRWELPDGSVEEPIPATRFYPYGIAFGPPEIATPPADTTAVEGSAARFEVELRTFTPAQFQWQVNEIDVPAATSSVYLRDPVSLADHNARVRVRVWNEFDTLISPDATLTVSPDVTPPHIVQVQNIGADRVQILFSEPIEPASATQPDNYTLDRGAAVIEAIPGPTPERVTLTTSPLSLGITYTLTVTGVQDRASSPNPIPPGTRVEFTVQSFALVDIGNPPIPGSLTPTPEGHDLEGSGRDIAGVFDECQFAWQEVAGDFDLKVRVAALSPVDPWTKAGLMARQTLEPNSPLAAALATPSLSGCFFTVRPNAGGQTISTGHFPVNYPYTWLRLKRAGNIFSGYASYDGQQWHALGQRSILLADPLLVGLTLTSRDRQQSARAAFRDFADASADTIADALPQVEPLGPSSRRTGLVLSEIHYRPESRADGQNLEFIELYNSQAVPEDLSGVQITGSISYTFPTGTLLPPGGFLVVARYPAAVSSAYGLSSVLGPYQRSLQLNSGTVQVRGRSGALLLEADYSNEIPWPAAADGAGHSLVLARPSYGEGNLEAWAASRFKGGSPGALDPVQTDPLDGVVINEFLAHTDLPAVDYIELYNHSNEPVDVSGAWLSDRPNNPKFQIPGGTVIAPRGFLVYTETELGFALSSAGEAIFFTNPDQTRVIDAYRFGAQANSITTGRYPDGAPGFQPLITPTPGEPNAPILIHEVVINEIMFNPITGDDDDEFLELHNRGQTAADLSHWRLLSGISYTFPPGTTLPAGGYLVVTRDRDRFIQRYPHLHAGNTFGNYSGRLANSGERIVLARPDDPTLPNQDFVTVNEVTYADGGRWGNSVNRGGSSLELIDARSDNRRADNWRDSDESAKSEWVTVEHTGVLNLGQGQAIELHVMLLGRGECLLDNVEVFIPGEANRVTNGSFESGIGGWIIQGNHVRSRWNPNEGFQSNASLHLRASGGGDNGANRIKTRLTSAFSVGNTVTLRARARWLSGHPQLLLRLKGNYLEASGTLHVPAQLGTPGLPNSSLVPNAGPAIFDVSHYPVLPLPDQPVRVTARIHDPDGVAAFNLNYRRDPFATLTTLPMRDDGQAGDAIAGDGLFTATIPGHTAGALVAFHLTATDAHPAPASNRFPSDAPTREALVRFGELEPFGSFGTYRLWLTQASVSEWTQRESLSNQALDTTFVYGQHRAIYNAGVRYRGSPFIRPNYNGPTGNLCAYVFEVPRDDRFLGTREFNLDWLEQPGRDDTLQREKMSFWIADQLGVPFSYQAYINVFVNGVRRGKVYTDSQQPNSDYISAWFPDRDDGEIYKIDDWFEFNDSVQREFNVDATLGNFTTTGGVKKQARYRWNWERKSNRGLDDDYTRLFELVDAVNTPPGTDTYTDNISALVDIEQWMRVFAARRIVADWDGYGYNRGKNQFAYKRPGEGWQMLLWDLDFSLGGGSDGPTAGLFSANDGLITRMYSHPPFRRTYLRAFHDAVYGPLQPEHMHPVLDANYAAFLGNQISVSSPAAVKTWVGQRRNYLLGQLNNAAASLAITTNNGQDFSTPNNLLVLEGTAPVYIRTLTVNGAPYPVRWPTVTAWRLEIPLVAGPNPLRIEGLDTWGNPVPDTPATITVTFTGTPAQPQDHLVINEIMYHPANPGAEFVEIHNTSLTHAFDLTGCRLAGVNFNFPGGTVIRPNGFLVVAADRVAFANAYGSHIPVTGEYPGRLQHAGERLRLLRVGTGGAPDQVYAEVTYGSTPPWPTDANGQGPSLQLIDPTRDNHRVGNWATAAIPTEPLNPQTVVLMTHTWRYNQNGIDLGTPWRQLDYDDSSWPSGRALLYVEESALPAPKNTPLTLGRMTYYFRTTFTNTFPEGTPLTLALTTIIDDGAVFYLNGQEIFRLRMPEGPINYNTPASVVNNATLEGPFELTTDALRPGLNVLAVEVHQNQIGSSDIVHGAALELRPTASGPFTPGAPNSVRANLPAFPSLWLNEIQPVSVQGERDNFNEPEPWTELFHAGTASLGLDGFYLSDDPAHAGRWAFPPGAAIAPGEFRLIWLDAEPGETTATHWHADFRPNPNGGTLLLSRWVSDRFVIIDYLHYPAVQPDRSYGRFPNGDPGSFHFFFVPTPGAANVLDAPAVQVRINEWMAANSGAVADPADGQFDDWFELYNAGTSTADLSGFTLTDSLTDPARFVIPQGITIPPDGFLLVWADDQVEQNSLFPDLHVNFRLSADGEAIGLFAPDGSLVDGVIFGPQTSNISQGRFPDGAPPPFHFMRVPTPGTPNTLAGTGPTFDPALFELDPDGTLWLGWTSEPGTTYLVQFKDQLEDPVWQELDRVTATDFVTRVADALDPSHPCRFYRLVID